MNQTDLFDRPEPVTKYQPHSDTSRSAARQIESQAESLRGKVYRFLKECPHYGATDEELQSILNMEANTQRPRRVELVDKGLVYDSGKKRKTKSGRSAVVWCAR